MERLTSNKDVSEMGMYELAHNSCYIKDGKARYRDFELNIDARDLIRKIAVEFNIFENGCAELIDDESFDETLLDYLQYGYDTEEGLISLLYRNLWAMADLHDKLKEYEEMEDRKNISKLNKNIPKELSYIKQLANSCENEVSKNNIIAACDNVLKMCNDTFNGYCRENLELYRRLQEYEDLDEEGKFPKPPCKIGDAVWDNDFGRPYIVTGFSFGDLNDDCWMEEEREEALKQVIVYYKNQNGSITGCFAASEIGKTVFLTREEAEQDAQK